MSMAIITKRAKPFHRRVAAWVWSRLPELGATGMMLGIAVCVIATPDTIRMGAFRYMLQAGWTPFVVVAFFGCFGTLRIAALLANGNWPKWGRILRSFCALMAALLWAQMAYALLLLTPTTGTFSLGIPVYVVLTLVDLFAAWWVVANDDPDH